MDIEEVEEFALPEAELQGVPWPAWAVTLGVVGFCVAFWAGVYYAARSFFG